MSAFLPITLMRRLCLNLRKIHEFFLRGYHGETKDMHQRCIKDGPHWPVADSEGEPTEVQKWRFGSINCRLGLDGRIEDDGRYTLRSGRCRLGAMLSVSPVQAKQLLR
jgi:hypothetical protein